MNYEITIKGKIWLIDLMNKTLTRKDNLNVVRELDEDTVEWFSHYLSTVYGKRLFEN